MRPTSRWKERYQKTQGDKQHQHNKLAKTESYTSYEAKQQGTSDQGGGDNQIQREKNKDRKWTARHETVPSK